SDIHLPAFRRHPVSRTYPPVIALDVEHVAVVETAGHSKSAIDALEPAPRARTGGYEPTVAAENPLRARATRGEGSRAQVRLEVGAVSPSHPRAGVVLPRRGAVEDRERAHAVRRQRVRELVRARNHQGGDQVGVTGGGRVDAHVDRGAGAPIGALRDVADGELVSPARLHIPELDRGPGGSRDATAVCREIG